ncbi:MAG TPA: TolC family protein [Gemmatimonadaceae bacterium]|nr:TolC family protein [Gemmatimonadaceae bacterium]
MAPPIAPSHAPSIRALLAGAALAAVVLTAPRARAQQRYTRAQVVAAALTSQPLIALAGADSATAAADVATARAYPNPTFSFQHTKDIPRHHSILDIPLDFPWVRNPRIGAATAGQQAATLRLEFVRASVAFVAETSYARALALQEHARLGRRDALDADSLLHMARRRLEAGDASELDVHLAEINAGQIENTAQDDSLTAVLAVLDLQRLMGISADTLAIALTDSLEIPSVNPPDPADSGAAPFAIAAARADLDAAQRSYVFERRNVFLAPSFQAGIEGGDPTGQERGALPLFGVTLPLPLFDRHGGLIATAQAARDRARAQLALATRESDAARLRSARERALAIARAERDRQLLVSADTVARMSLAAYGEGASTLPNVLEAQRNARAVLLQFVDDVATAEIADAALRLAAASGKGP